MDTQDLFKLAASAHSVGTAEKHMRLLTQFVRRRQIGGAVAGAAAGAAAGAHAGNKQDQKAGTGRHHKAVARGIAGGLAGAVLGYTAGTVSAVPRLARSAKRHVSYAQKVVNKPGGYSAPKASAGSHPFWSKIDAAHRDKVKGIAAHAKRTQGPEGDAARNVLRTKAKKLGFDYDEAIKHAALAKTATSTRRALSALRERARRTDGAARAQARRFSSLGGPERIKHDARSFVAKHYDRVQSNPELRRRVSNEAAFGNRDPRFKAFMEERNRRLFRRHLERKHGGKIRAAKITGAAAAIGAMGVGVLHHAPKRHKDKK